MKMALASPRVRASGIESTEFPALAEEMEVYAVPRIVVDGIPRWDGSVRSGSSSTASSRPRSTSTRR